jgi:hypothetical protein
MSKKKRLPTYHERMLKNRDDLNIAGNNLMNASEQLNPYLLQLRNNAQYVEYILIGSQIIEYALSHLLLQYQHTVNVALFGGKNLSMSEYNFEIYFEVKPRWSMNNLIEELEDTFNFDDPIFIEKVKTLAKCRNNFAHHLVDLYKGKTESASQEIKPYAEQLPVEEIFEEVLKIQRQLVEEITKRAQASIK